MHRQFLEVLQLLRDAITLIIPYAFTKQKPYAFAFLVHPRDSRDLFRKLPFLKHLPQWVIHLFEYYWTPATVTTITGLKGSDGEQINGFVIAIPMTAQTMLKHRDRARIQIRKAVRLARNKGARIAGLGALTSSLSHGGLDLIDIPGIAITTGHAYTGYTVTETLHSILNMGSVSLNQLRIGIVGAAGSIGTITADLLARSGVRSLALIDMPHKEEKLLTLATRLRAHTHCSISTHTDLTILPKCHGIVTATNAPDALLRSHHISPGTIIVDDAQPSDVADEVLENPDVLVAAAGAVFTPNIKTHFSMGLRGEQDNYCCLAEVMILAHTKQTDHFVLDRPTMHMVDEVSRIGATLGFRPAIHQNAHGHIPHHHIEHVLTLLKSRV